MVVSEFWAPYMAAGFPRVLQEDWEEAVKLQEFTPLSGAPKHHLYSILLVKQGTKVSPDSRGGN